MPLWVRNGFLAQAGTVAVFLYYSIRSGFQSLSYVGLMFVLISVFAWSICFADDHLDLCYGREKATKITLALIIVGVIAVVAAFVFLAGMR